VAAVLRFRSFRNNDPPGLMEVWNQAFTGRGAVHLRGSYPLERFAYAKPYFDPDGLILALDGEERVGFAHAGFGPNPAGNGLSREHGVTCLLGVRPSHRRRGIGSELLGRCEQYLQGHGAQTISAGCMRPLNPFYLGLYGGSEMPGFLTSDSAAGPFLEHHGYEPWETALVFQRRLDQPVNVVDARFAALRRRFELRVLPRSGPANWWEECVLGPLEPIEFRLEDTASRRPVARAEVWEMETFSWTWGLPTVGVVNVEVLADLRRQGLAKFLLTNLLRYLQEQYFALVEMQAAERNQVAVKFCRSLGFEQVDFGRTYRRGPNAEQKAP
jgi:ribosomal protein S18 acetylase RimI-like enzyme